MKAPGLVFSDAAIADILDQSDWYAGKAGRSWAKRWEAGVTATLLQIARGPGTGSPAGSAQKSFAAPVACPS